MSNKGGRVSPDYLADIAPEYAIFDICILIGRNHYVISSSCMQRIQIIIIFKSIIILLTKSYYYISLHIILKLIKM